LPFGLSSVAALLLQAAWSGIAADLILGDQAPRFPLQALDL
jgi:hypothetical protein